MAISHVLVAKSILGTPAVWRQHILAAHPTDKRNTRASELLELLSTEPTASEHARSVLFGSRLARRRHSMKR